MAYAKQKRAKRALLPPLLREEALRLQTGVQLDVQVWRDRCQRRAALTAQTERLADALADAGLDVRKPSEVVLVGAVTGVVEEVSAYRKVCFLPLVAQRERAPMKNALSYFVRSRPHLRYAVVTSGARVPAFGPLRKRIQELHRRVSKWAFEASRDWEVDVFFRATEFTRDESGSYHPHANVVYAPRRRLPAHRWKAFLAWSHEFLGAHWKDAGEIAKVDEIVKYPFKPSELDGIDGGEALWLFEQTTRLKFMQPMNAFADFRCEIDRTRHKVALIAGIPRLVEKAPAREKTGASGAGENLFMAMTLPQFLTPWAEPCLCVMHYTRTPQTMIGRLRLERMLEARRQARTWWDEAGAPSPETAKAYGDASVVADNVEPFKPRQKAAEAAAIKVHTGPPTVQPPALPMPELPPHDPETGEVLVLDWFSRRVRAGQIEIVGRPPDAEPFWPAQFSPPRSRPGSRTFQKGL